MAFEEKSPGGVQRGKRGVRMEPKESLGKSGVVGSFIAFVLFLFDFLEVATKVKEAFPTIEPFIPAILIVGTSVLGCWSLMIGVIAFMNWMTKRKFQREQQQYNERDSAIGMMEIVRDYHHAGRLSEKGRSKIDAAELREHVLVCMEELESMGLVPPSGLDSESSEWVSRMNWLLPRVLVRGTKEARKENRLASKNETTGFRSRFSGLVSQITRKRQ